MLFSICLMSCSVLGTMGLKKSRSTFTAWPASAFWKIGYVHREFVRADPLGVNDVEPGGVLPGRPAFDPRWQRLGVHMEPDRVDPAVDCRVHRPGAILHRLGEVDNHAVLGGSRSRRVLDALTTVLSNLSGTVRGWPRCTVVTSARRTELVLVLGRDPGRTRRRSGGTCGPCWAGRVARLDQLARLRRDENAR